jgi:heme-degrading monooxygenase HmoA
MSVYATNMFSTQPGRARDLIDTLTRVLPDTLKHGGCELIQILHDQDDPNSVLAITRWTTREHYEDYLSWRDGTGDTAMFPHHAHRADESGLLRHRVHHSGRTQRTEVVSASRSRCTDIASMRSSARLLTICDDRSDPIGSVKKLV